jgi:hypothetical protein
MGGEVVKVVEVVEVVEGFLLLKILEDYYFLRLSFVIVW